MTQVGTRSGSRSGFAGARSRLGSGSPYDHRGLVFCREDGAPICPRRFSPNFDRRVTAAELPSLPLKNPRHTQATILPSNGVPPKVIQERLGHAVTITLRVYTHAIPAMLAEATAKAAALID